MDDPKSNETSGTESSSSDVTLSNGQDVTLGVDVGGTFTDVALVVGTDLVTAKVPTTDDQSVGVREGIEKACDAAGIEPSDVDGFTHAMTVSVNALLEREGATTALVTTEGFRDVLEIGRQDRPSLYDLDAEKPEPLVPRRRRFELDERATPDGIERSIEASEVRSLAETIASTDAEAVAICFLYAYSSPSNERQAARTLREELSVPVSASHEVLAEFREFERTATTVVDAYVTPAIEGYLGRLIDRAAELGVPTPRIMQANGGIADADLVRERAVTTVLSGPAGGVVGAAASVRGSQSSPDRNGDERIVTFDMGGTSTDVSLVRGGTVERTTETLIDRIPIRTPMVDVNTVGAGGGSIAWIDDGGALRVGPRSAGANPGPACYDRGGNEPTVTDANVVLGYIGPETALGGELRLDVEAAETALSGLAERAGLADARSAARGVHRVANATMTRAIRSVTVERGHDPRGFDLVAFGGAGPMHAAAMAASLEIERVIVPQPAGVLSAYGLLAADEVHDAVRTVHARLDSVTPDRLETVYEELAADVLADSSDPDRTALEFVADCRYVGQSFELTVPVEDVPRGRAGLTNRNDTSEMVDPVAIERAFDELYEQTYGYELDDPVEAVNLRVTGSIARKAPETRIDTSDGDARIGEREAFFPGEEMLMTSVYERARLPAGRRIEAPAIIEQDESTTVIPPGWRGTVRPNGAIVMEAVDD